MSASCYNAHASLVTGHAYSMLGAVKLSNGVQLVKVRNPWGREKYSGPYSDDSSDWTDALKAEAGMVKADDGIFFIPLADFKKAFTDYSVLMYQDWKKSEKVVTGDGKKFELAYTSDIDEEIVLQFEYLNTRHIPNSCPTDSVNYNLYFRNSENPREPNAVAG